MPNGEVAVCPARAELADFVRGNLADPAFQQIARHVSACVHCAQTLEALDDETDSFPRSLRQVSTGSASGIESVPASLLAAALSCFDTQDGAAASRAESPRWIGKFEILEELGHGSFGHVFRARDTELARTVAIKMLRAG